VTRDTPHPHPPAADTEPATDAPRLAIGELADQAGVSRRAVRFYVQRGLLPAPAGGGRGSFYTTDHLATLLTIKRLQEEGVSLTAIAERLGLGPLEDARAPESTTAATRPAARWLRVEVADGLELHVREDQLARFPPGRLAQALDAALEHLAGTSQDPRQDPRQNPRPDGDTP
jgi:DNA-binding transcriptional MerR regulator